MPKLEAVPQDLGILLCLKPHAGLWWGMFVFVQWEGDNVSIL
jgi:hypothetical protein